MEPRYSQRPRDGRNLFSTISFRYIEFFSHILLLIRAKKIVSLYRGFTLSGFCKITTSIDDAGFVKNLAIESSRLGNSPIISSFRKKGSPGLTVTVNFIFTSREPNVYKPHGFFFPLSFAFV